MKKNGLETMEILGAFDKTKSAHSAARLAGCDPKTVRRLVARREAGLGVDAPIDRPRLVDGHTDLVEQLVDGSEDGQRGDGRADRPFLPPRLARHRAHRLCAHRGGC